MKKIFLIISSIILMCNCNNEDIAGIPSFDIIGHNFTLTATIEQSTLTRSTINYVGNVSWTDNDYIGVFGEKNENVKFHYASNNNADNFTGNFDSDKNKIKFAYYPYNNSIQYDGHSIRFNMPENNEYHSENKAPMIGKVVSDKHVSFCQTCGVLLLKIIGMPQNAAKIKISSDDESPFLSGTAVIANVDDQYPICEIENGSHIISYDISTLESKEKLMRLYVPLQIGFYKKLYISILDDSQSTIKMVSMSNTDIARGNMINTSVINCSDLLYCTIMPQTCFEGTQWTEGMITSSEKLLLRKEEEDKSSIMTIYDLRNESELSIVTDSLGNVTELILNDEEYISVVNNDKGQISFYHYLNNSIDYIEGTNVDSLLCSKSTFHTDDTRAGVDKVYFFQTINNAYSIFNIFKSYKKAADYQTSLEEQLVAANTIAGLGIKNDEVDLINGITGSDQLGIALEIASYAEKKFNKHLEKFYNLLCGATISVIEPTIEGDKLRFGYSVRNTSKIPHGKAGFDTITRKCYVAVIRQWNGTRMPGVMTVASGEQYGKEEIVANNDFDKKDFYIPYEKGYTYYFVARIILETTHTETTLHPQIGYVKSPRFRKVTYSSDIEMISLNNIGEIKENSITYNNEKVEFNFYILGEKLFGRTMGVELYHDGELVWENYDNIAGINKCVLTLNKNDFDCDYNLFKATAKGRWQIRSYVLYDMTGEPCYSEFVDFDKLVYTQYPSVTFYNPIIQGTEEIITRTRSNDNEDSKKYMTFFSYGLIIKGAFWMDRIDAKSDTEGPIGYLSKNNIKSDVIDAFDYSWTYSEKKPITPTLWYDITLRNGEILKSANELKFTGFPISEIEYYDSFISSGD